MNQGDQGCGVRFRTFSGDQPIAIKAGNIPGPEVVEPMATPILGPDLPFGDRSDLEDHLAISLIVRAACLPRSDCHNQKAVAPRNLTKKVKPARPSPPR